MVKRTNLEGVARIMGSQIEMRLVGTEARVRPSSYLGADMFFKYKAACDGSGAIFNRDLKCQMAELDAVPGLIAELKKQGFEPRVDSPLQTALLARADAAKQDIKGADARLASIRDAVKAQGLALFPFQEAGVAWLAPRARAILADDMGLGKTIQALVAAPTGAPVLVICPAAVKGVWVAEAKRWRPDLTTAVLKGRSSFRWPQPGEMVVLNYDILPDDPNGGGLTKADPGLFDGRRSDSCPKNLTLIVDECHALKNRKALRSVRFRKLAKLTLKAGGRAWGLTGTPLLNKPPELWNLLESFELAKTTFGHWSAFAKMFGGWKAQWGYQWGKPGPRVKECLRKTMLKRRREEVLPDLPTKMWEDREVKIDAGMQAMCDKFMADYGDAFMDSLGVAIKTKKGGNIGFEEISAVRAALATAKIPAMMDVVIEHEQADEKLIVFSAHRRPIDELAKRPGWDTITGDVAPAKRTEIVKRFQAGQLKGLALTIQAGGIGLTLTRAHRALFVDLAWTPALNSQAEDRICRIGQDKGVIITRLVAEHQLDRRVNELLSVKQALITGSVDAAAVKDAAAGADPGAFEAAAAAGKIIGNGAPQPKPRREARGKLEEWAFNGVLQLALLDPDFAAQENGVGFNRLDGKLGHSLADQIRAKDGLTEAQWHILTKMLRKYHGQIGQVPDES